MTIISVECIINVASHSFLNSNNHLCTYFKLPGCNIIYTIIICAFHFAHRKGQMMYIANRYRLSVTLAVEFPSSVY